jgi:hypothetical protein
VYSGMHSGFTWSWKHTRCGVVLVIEGLWFVGEWNESIHYCASFEAVRHRADVM